MHEILPGINHHHTFARKVTCSLPKIPSSSLVSHLRDGKTKMNSNPPSPLCSLTHTPASAYNQRTFSPITGKLRLSNILCTNISFRCYFPLSVFQQHKPALDLSGRTFIFPLLLSCTHRLFCESTHFDLSSHNHTLGEAAKPVRLESRRQLNGSPSEGTCFGSGFPETHGRMLRLLLRAVCVISKQISASRFSLLSPPTVLAHVLSRPFSFSQAPGHRTLVSRIPTWS